MLDIVYDLIMPENFNIKGGFVKLVKSLVHSEEFVNGFVNLLLGRKDAARELKTLFLRKSMGYTLNEVVMAHRLFRANLNESLAPNNEKDILLLRQIAKLPKKSLEFQSKVIVKTLKKPGTVAALYKLIRSEGTDPKAWAVLAPAVVDSISEAIEDEDKEHVKFALSESVEASYGGRMPVNVYIGRFQPFHLGHLSCLQKAAEYGLRTVICPVMKGSSKSAGEHPFESIEGEMFETLKDEYQDLIADVIPVKNAFIEFWVYALRERGFEPITWTTGQDRAPSYQSMVDKYREKYELSPNLKVLALDKNVDAEGGSADNTGNISGTRIRECLMNDDREGFQRQMPECLWPMYDEMRHALLGDEAPAQHISSSLMEDEMRRKKLDEAITKLVKGIQ